MPLEPPRLSAFMQAFNSWPTTVDYRPPQVQYLCYQFILDFSAAAGQFSGHSLTLSARFTIAAGVDNMTLEQLALLLVVQVSLYLTFSASVHAVQQGEGLKTCTVPRLPEIYLNQGFTQLHEVTSQFVMSCLLCARIEDRTGSRHVTSYKSLVKSTFTLIQLAIDQ